MIRFSNDEHAAIGLPATRRGTYITPLMSVNRYQLKKLDSEPAIMIYRKPFDPMRGAVKRSSAKPAAEAKKLALEKMFDNSLLQEIQKEMTK